MSMFTVREKGLFWFLIALISILNNASALKFFLLFLFINFKSNFSSSSLYRTTLELGSFNLNNNFEGL